jgi:arylsulfatase A-like enzyme
MMSSPLRSLASSSLAVPRLTALIAILIVAGCDGEGWFRSEPASGFSCASCNLVLLSLDTLRADHVSTYGYPRKTTPFIDRWAEDAIVFESAFATAPKTAESHMSVFTGLYTTVHQVLTFARAGRVRPDQIQRLSDRIGTLPEVLKESGYHTVGFHGGGNVAAKFGFGRGFDRYEWADLGTGIGQERISQFVDSMSARPDERFFLFVHSYHVHAPYTPRALPSGSSAYQGDIEHDKKTLREMASSGQCESPERCFWSLVDESSAADVRHLESLYDAEITELDARVGALLQRLAAVPGETLVVLIGDHGEEFREHGEFQHNQLYNEILKVPLIIRHPRLKEGMRVRSRVSLIDLLPTLMEMLEIEVDLRVQGSSFLPLLVTDRAPGEIYSEYPPFFLYTLVARDKKLILQGFPSRDIDSYHKVELYDLRSDPAEKHNLAGNDPDLDEMFEQLVERLFESIALRDTIQEGDAPATEVLDEVTIEQLEALGYLE